MSDKSLNANVNQLYRAAVQPGQWHETFTQISSMLNCHAMHFAMFDETSNQHQLTIIDNIPDQSADEFEREHLFHDIRLTQLDMFPHRVVSYDYLHSTEEWIQKDPIYNWRLEQSGLKYYGVIFSRNIPNILGFLTVHRGERYGHLHDDEIVRMRQISPHVLRSLEVAHWLDQKSISDHAGLHSFSDHTSGIALLDGEGALIFMNDTLRGIIARGDGLVSRDHTLMPLKAAEQRTLQYDLKWALDPVSTQPPPGQATRTISRLHDAPPYLVTIIPFPADDLILGPKPPLALMIVRDPGMNRAIDTGRLQVAFGLTTRETQIAALLWSGHTPQQISDRLHLTLETIRTHLKSIRQKTGTHTLAQVVSRLAPFSY